MPRAVLSVSDKTGLIELARGLAARGFELVSTGGTARALADAGLAVASVSDVTGVPEMMDGRVKTLHPKIHGGILARRDDPHHLAAAREHGIGLVDLVVVNLYPFERTAATPGVTFDELVEQIDIGGPSLVRAAAKNFRGVLVVVDPRRYADVLRELDRTGGPSLEFRFDLAREAFRHTREYDATISATLDRWAAGADAFAARPLGADGGAGDDVCTFTIEKVRTLRYGENPHQQGALWQPRGAPLGLTFVQGKELSYTNLLDLDAAARIAAEFDEPAAVVVKHTNPCGAAIGRDAADAYIRARDADALSAFGGIVALNRAIDEPAAAALTSTFIEAVIAPSVDDRARPLLARKDKMRVLTRAPADRPDRNRWATTDVRSVFGGLLFQDRDRVVEAASAWGTDRLPDGFRVATRRQPTPAEWIALRFAWRLCAHVKSNAVIFTDATRTLAIGAGQMSRVDAVKVAIMKAESTKVPLVGSVAASDAFFPFRDGLDAVVGAGATAIVQPGGSVRDAEVIAAADEHGIAMVFTGRRHFRH
jgi:phosphoribosylaminoimidazolecarboxamide formyltransferase / IMP cyclohydrolase